MTDLTVLAIFALVYLGMILGRLPGLALDRTGVALLGAIALLALGRVSLDEAWTAIDVPTIALLLGLMVVSAQFRLGGFYTAVTAKLALADVSPRVLLALLIIVSGALSAVLANDIVCLAMTPVLIDGCIRRRLNPVPFLLALACAANIGSAATLIGNPQNMLIGQTLNLSFAGYLLEAIVPATLGCGAIWLVITWQMRREGAWTLDGSPSQKHHIEAQPFDAYQSAKAIAVVLFIMVAFLFTEWPRDIVALGAAGVLLLSRRMHSRAMLGLVDWQLLILFIGLFVVNHAFASTGMLDTLAASLRNAGVDPAQPGWLFAITAVLSNLVSNVPAVMLLLPFAEHPMAGTVLAVSSTLAGNLIIVGSIANIIVVDLAARQGITINWKRHARTGMPITIISLVIAAFWLWLWAAMSGS
ncbi:MAG TPA: anion transporter [Phycisphaerales bacterium]|nr:anion transporter [Phycisphaerales bacterium]HRQ74506.1 anion transporter [Phycisphaerales bacterium]